MQKQELIKYLDEYLKIKDYKDSSKNWLQIDNEKQDITKIGYSVDASTYIFDKAIKENVDLILCHHGVFWWYEEKLVWIPYERTKKLIKNNIWLYACHIPLDAHNEVWNNIWLLKWFLNNYWIRTWEYEVENFWLYNDVFIWFWLKFQKQIHISTLQTVYCENLQLQKKLYNFWNKEYINSIAFVSWGSSWSYKEAFDKWYDLFLTWEATHNKLISAKEIWQSILLWWHYETEKIWPKLLSYHLKEKFWLEVVFLDEKY